MICSCSSDSINPVLRKLSVNLVGRKTKNDIRRDDASDHIYSLQTRDATVFTSAMLLFMLKFSYEVISNVLYIRTQLQMVS